MPMMFGDGGMIKKPDNLTNKQWAFVLEYPKDWNATQAAIRAGYSKDTAHAMGWENLTKPLIKDALKSVYAELAMDTDTEFAGALLRPHAFIMDENPDKRAVIHNACKQVGVQLISKGRMSRRLLGVISQPLISEENLRQRYNGLYERVTS